MKLTPTLLKEVGLEDLMQGTLIEVPSLFEKSVDLLFRNENSMIVFMRYRYLNDYRMVKKVMIILNQLVRYYQSDVILYCFSYRLFVSGEKIYHRFEKRH